MTITEGHSSSLHHRIYEWIKSVNLRLQAKPLNMANSVILVMDFIWTVWAL